MDCTSGNWSCVYHACMSNECQAEFVFTQGVYWGLGQCGKPKLTADNNEGKLSENPLSLQGKPINQHK